MAHRVHIFGASGSGTSTLGHHLAAAVGARHLDADDYYWLDTDPPFTAKREPDARVAQIEKEIEAVADWVLSGSVCSWGDPLMRRFTLVVFLYLDPRLRMARLVARERRRYGSRVLPGGDMYAQHLDFMRWARSYDGGSAPTRSLDLHERWMRRLDCPVIRLNSQLPSHALVDQVLERMAT